MFKSNAQWPEHVYTGSDGKGITTDEHDSAEAAWHVCRMLERRGFGGNGKEFPIATWVTDAEGNVC